MKKTTRRMGLALFFLISFQLAEGGTVGDLGKLIPRTIGEFEAAEEDAVYDRHSLYDYMDGGAEVYLAFDFREVFARTYACPGGRQLVLNIYDMGSPEEAFGIFSCDRADPTAGIGQDSEYGFGLLRFWQGSYFVTVNGPEEDEEAGKAVLELGRAVAECLGPPGPKPALLNVLPVKGLRPERTSYFHSNINLNNRFFVAADNILMLGTGTDCVFAEYETAPQEAACLLLIRYPDAEKAGAARQSFLAVYLPEAGPEGEAQTENKKWVSAHLRENILSIVFEAPDEGWARDLQQSLRLSTK